MGKKGRSSRNDSSIITYKHGIFNYHIRRTPDGLICPCKKTHQNRHTCCDHVKGLLKSKVSDDFYIKFYPKFKDIISAHYDNIDFKNILKDKADEVMSDDCGFCCNALYIDQKSEGWVMCEHCYKLTHIKCFEKWKTRDSSCMYCRYDPKKETIC